MPQFQCSGTAKRFPDMKIGSSKLVMRINDAASTAKVYFKIDRGTLVTSTNADGFLKAGESIEICGQSVSSPADVSVLDASDNPIIFWGLF